VDVGELYLGFIFDQGGDGPFGGGVGEESQAVALGFDGDEECAGFEHAGVGGDGFDFDIGGEGGKRFASDDLAEDMDGERFHGDSKEHGRDARGT
jgi:hypothetical protein